MMNATRKIALVVALALLTLAAVACGGPPTAGVAQAAASTAALLPPTNVTAQNTPEGHVIVKWDADAAPFHRVGWALASDVTAARAAGDWLEAFHFADTKRDTDYTIKYLARGQKYWFIVGSLNYRFGSAVAWDEAGWKLRTTASVVAAAEPTPEPTRPIPAGMVKVKAPIESVEIIVAESYPPQYFAHVISGLPNGCVEFYDYEETRSGNAITITVFNLEPAPSNNTLACAAIYLTHELGVPLGTDFEPGETYTVTVNGVVKTFTAEGGPSDDGTDSDAYGEVVPAPIESVAIHVDTRPDGEDYLVVEYALPNACHELHQSELSYEGGKLLVNILNYRTDYDADGNPIACAEIYRTEKEMLLIGADVQIGQTFAATVNGVKRTVTATAVP